MIGTPVESKTLEERITATELRQAAQEINSSRADSNAGSDHSYQILEKLLESQRALVETGKESKPKPGSEDHLAQTFRIRPTVEWERLDNNTHGPTAAEAIQGDTSGARAPSSRRMGIPHQNEECNRASVRSDVGI